MTSALPEGRHLIAVADGFTTDPNPAAPTLSTRNLVAFEDELAARLSENADPDRWTALSRQRGTLPPTRSTTSTDRHSRPR